MKNRKSLRSKPWLLVMFGFPGSGKTYVARQLARYVSAAHLNSDRIRLDIIDKPKYNQAENKVVFRVMDYMTEELLACGLSVIYDANATKRIYRQRLRQLAKRQQAKYLLIWLQTSVPVAMRRIKQRSKLKSSFVCKYHRPINESVLHWIKGDMEAPTKREPHLIVDGQLDFSEQHKLIRQHVKILQ